MKKLFLLTILAHFLADSRAQYGYQHCNTLDRTVLMGDSLLINLDEDTLPDAVLRTFVDPGYGRTARLVSLKPNTGAWYLNDVKFKAAGPNDAVNYPENYALNYTLMGGENYSAGPYVFRQNIHSYFGPGESGYVCYSHGSYSVSYDPSFGNDTFYHHCVGWIALSVGATLDTVRVTAVCGCDPQSITTGQPSSYPTAINEVPNEHVGLVSDGFRAYLVCDDARLSYAVYDAIGRVLQAGKLGIGRNDLDLPPSFCGISIVAVKDESGRIVKSFKALVRD